MQTTSEYILKGKSIKELEQFFVKIGEPAYRGEQAFRRINKYLEVNLDNFSEFSLALRTKLKGWNALPLLKISSTCREAGLESEDQNSGPTEKVIFTLDTESSISSISPTGKTEENVGQENVEQENAEQKKKERQKKTRQIESVWIAHPRRRTICISSQVGCSLSCSFCATGTLPFRGNLQTWEILEQVYVLIRRHPKERLSNIVFMGMGEPFHNYENVIRAARILHHPNGLNLSASHITISTAGIIPSIERFIREREPFNLAVSLNHSQNDGRRSIMNVNQKYPLEHLLNAARKFTKELDRRITFEYVMIPGINMQKKAKEQLIKIARSVRCRLNLIPLNTNLQGWRRPSSQEIYDFQSDLLEAGLSVFNRGSPGLKINAACGMLALNQAKSSTS